MRAYEPSLSVAPMGTDDTVAGVNFTVQSLTREDRIAEVFKPRIRKGFRKGQWVFGVCIAGTPYFSPTPEPLMARVEAYWVEFFDSTMEEDFDFALAIADQMREAGVDWPVS